MVAPAVIILVIVLVVVIIHFVIAMSLLIATGNQETSNKNSLLAAGAMIGIAMPIIAIGFIFGIMHFNAVNKGQKKASLMWLFIILSSLGGILVVISSIIAFAVGNNLTDSVRQRNARAAGALALIGGGVVIIAFIILLVLFRKGKIQYPSSKKPLASSKKA